MLFLFEDVLEPGVEEGWNDFLLKVILFGHKWREFKIKYKKWFLSIDQVIILEGQCFWIFKAIYLLIYRKVIPYLHSKWLLIYIKNDLIAEITVTIIGL